MKHTWMRILVVFRKKIAKGIYMLERINRYIN